MGIKETASYNFNLGPTTVKQNQTEKFDTGITKHCRRPCSLPRAGFTLRGAYGIFDIIMPNEAKD